MRRGLRDDTFYRELPRAEVIWHVLRPISGHDLETVRDIGGCTVGGLAPPPGAARRQRHRLVALPLTEETASMLDRAALARMKPDAVLVNPSRGGVVDQHALVDALRTGGLATVVNG